MRDASGTVVPVHDADRTRSCRPNEVALSLSEVWVGTSGISAALAGLANAPYVFRCTDLRDFDAAVLSSPSVALSSEGGLAMLARKVIMDARRIGGRFQRMVIAVDSHCQADGLARLAGFLSSTVDLPVEVQSTELAFQQYLSGADDSAPAASLAILESQSYFSSVATGIAKSFAVPGHSGLMPLYQDLVGGVGPGSSLSRWSERKVWREFVQWYYEERGEQGPHIHVFCPYLVDRKLPRRSIAFSQARLALQPVFSTAIAALFAGLAAAGGAHQVYLMGDDAIKLGLVDFLRGSGQKLPFQVHPVALAQVAVRMAQYGDAAAGSSSAPLSVGILVGADGGAAFKPAIAAGTPLPAAGQLRVGASGADQRRFKLNIAASGVGAAAVSIRTIVFETRAASPACAEVDVRFELGSSGALRVNASDGASGARLEVSSSKVAARDGSGLDGPESLASLAIVTID